MNQKEILILSVAILGMYVYYNKDKRPIIPVDPHIVPEGEKHTYDISGRDNLCNKESCSNLSDKKKYFI